MNVQPVFTSTVTEDGLKLFALASAEAKRLEGTRTSKAYQIGSATGVLQVFETYARVYIITGSTRGFGCKPRSAENWIYDNSDTNNAVVVSKDEDTWQIDSNALPVADSDIVYGNIDWKGPIDEDGNSPVLSWKGPPSRYFPLDFRTYYEGAVTLEEDVLTYEYGVPLEVPYYTPFGPNVYENGAILTTLPTYGYSPTKVLGAAYGLDDNLFVIAGINYRESTNPAGTTGGHYTEIFYLSGAVFKRIAYFSSSRHSVPFFFNVSGTQAISVRDYVETIYTIIGKEYDPTDLESIPYSVLTEVIDTKNFTYSVNTDVTTDKKNNNVDIPADWAYVNKSDYPQAINLEQYTKTTKTQTINKTGTATIAADFKGDILAKATISLDAETTSSNIDKGGGYYDLLDEYPFDPPAPLLASIPYPLGVGACVSVSGGCPPYKYQANIPGVVINEIGCIIDLQCTPGGKASGYITVTDSRGESADTNTVIMNMPTAMWIQKEVIQYQMPDTNGFGNVVFCSGQYSWGADSILGTSRRTYSGYVHVNSPGSCTNSYDNCSHGTQTNAGATEASKTYTGMITTCWGAQINSSDACIECGNENGSYCCSQDTTLYIKTETVYEWECPP
jgi:hypothetical protein